MLVRDAVPGQVLFAPGRKAMIWRSSLTEDEKKICDSEGFRLAVLLPAWSDGALSRNFYDVRNHEQPYRSKAYADALLYLGPTYLSEYVGGLKKWHLFLVDGQKMALEGYEFRHLITSKN
tara:strand:- start:1323 stop:1682 length:360 start_codon:yes stop_codon:yes gene_type:complete